MSRIFQTVRACAATAAAAAADHSKVANSLEGRGAVEAIAPL